MPTAFYTPSCSPAARANAATTSVLETMPAGRRSAPATIRRWQCASIIRRAQFADPSLRRDQDGIGCHVPADRFCRESFPIVFHYLPFRTDTALMAGALNSPRLTMRPVSEIRRRKHADASAVGIDYWGPADPSLRQHLSGGGKRHRLRHGNDLAAHEVCRG